MRKDFQIAILFGLAALPAGVALMAAPEYIGALKEYPGLFFWSGLILAAALIIAAIVIAIRGEASEPQSGHRRRVIAFTSMVIYVLGNLVVFGIYFWPTHLGASSYSRLDIFNTELVKPGTGVSLPPGQRMPFFVNISMRNGGTIPTIASSGTPIFVTTDHTLSSYEEDRQITALLAVTIKELLHNISVKKLEQIPPAVEKWSTALYDGGDNRFHDMAAGKSIIYLFWVFAYSDINTGNDMVRITEYCSIMFGSSSVSRVCERHNGSYTREIK